MPSNRWRGLAYLAAGLCGYALFLLITLPLVVPALRR